MRRIFWFSAALVLLGSLAAVAQRNQPIYPAYDGFLKNPDGSCTIAFAYFSHNANTVTIAPGAANTFAPTPGDRMQPTAFKPGHWRFQCVMVVPPNFDGKIKWTKAIFSAPGLHELELAASDSEFTRSTRINGKVG